MILQQGNSIVYESRALTPTRERYAQIEKETVAIVYEAQESGQYKFNLITNS